MNNDELEKVLADCEFVEDTRKPLIDTGRKALHLEKHPKNLDFKEIISGTTYVVTSFFDKSAEEDILKKVNRLIFGGEMPE